MHFFVTDITCYVFIVAVKKVFLGEKKTALSCLKITAFLAVILVVMFLKL